MSSSIFRSVITSLVLALSLPIQAASEGDKPTVTVEVFSPLGLSTFRANRLDVYSFVANWELPAGGSSGIADLYFGLLTPDLKSAYTWTRQEDRFVLARGMLPMHTGVALNTPATYSSSSLAGADLRLTIPGSVAPGMYFVFALIAGAGTNPADPASWAQIEMRPLFVY